MDKTSPEPSRNLTIKTDRALVTMSERSLAVTAGLQEDAERKKFKAFLRRHPSFLIHGLSRFYPLDIDLLEQYADEWIWCYLSNNPALPWSPKIIRKILDRCDYESLPETPKQLWTPGFIDSLAKNGHGDKLQYIESIPWTSENFEQYIIRDDLDWWQKSQNQNTPWDTQLIQKFLNKWDWRELSDNFSLPWSISLIEQFSQNWDFSSLSTNPALPWSLALIERFSNFWDWKGLSENPGLPWSLDLIKQYEDRWCWGSPIVPCHAELHGVTDRIAAEMPDFFNSLSLSSNLGLLWNDPRPQWRERWFFVRSGLSGNPALPWSSALIERYADRWSWEGLSSNIGLPWSPEFFELFLGYWDFEQLSGNPNIPWSVEFLERFESYWDWNELSGNPSLPWSEWLIERFADRWDWRLLWLNPGLTLKNRILEKFEEHGKILEKYWDLEIFSVFPQPNWQSLWLLLRREDVIDLMNEVVKPNQSNPNLDPEILKAAITLVGFHVEAGCKDFEQVSRAVSQDINFPLGDLDLGEIQPYLRSAYEAIRHLPEDSRLDLSGFD